MESNNPSNFGGFLITIGFIIIGGTIYFYIRERATRNWLTTTGRIVESSVESGEDAVPRLTYQYDVDGKRYYGKRIAFGGVRFYGTKGTGQADEMVNRYRVGVEMPVYYNPTDPEQAVLWREHASGSVNFGIVMGIAFIIIGALMLLFGH